MAYFSKEIYDRKRDYARNIADEGLELIALYIVSHNKEYENYSDDDLDDEIEDLIEELEPIKELSFARHRMHSSSTYDSEDVELIGSEYSDGDTLIDQVNELNDTYDLVKDDLHYLDDPLVNEETYEDEDVADYFDVEEDEVTDDMTYKFVEHLRDEWNEIKDKNSEYIRSWFRELNKKFGTKFPD